jgi:hypothetical protein
VGERWVSTDKRAVRACVRACLLVSGVTPPGSRTASTRLLHRGTGHSALPLRPRPARRQRCIDVISGHLRWSSMPDASMTVLDSERPVARVLRLYKEPPSPAGHTHPPPPRLHALRARHERPLALQPEDQARRRGVWISLAGLRLAPDAPVASTPSFACTRFSATVESTPRP